MAAVKVSDIRALVRINLDDPLKWNEADLGVGSVPNQRIFQFPTRPVNPLSEVVTIDSAAKTRGVDYTILNEAGQLFFASPPAGGSMHAYWQYSRWSDAQLNQWIAEASRLLSVQAPKLTKMIYIGDATSVLNQGWTTDVADQRVFKVRSFDPPSPLGANMLWQEIPYWRWDEADHFLRLDGTFLAGDQFEVHALRRWADPDTVADQMDPGGYVTTSLLADTFTAFMVAGDPANWTAVIDGSNVGSYTQAGNVISTTLANNTAGAIRGGQPTWTDVSYTVRFQAQNSCFAYLGARFVDSNNQVWAYVNPTGTQIWQTVGGVSTFLAGNESEPFLLTNLSYYWATFTVRGNAVTMQVFNDVNGVMGSAISSAVKATAFGIPPAGYVIIRAYNGTGISATIRFGGSLSGSVPVALVGAIEGVSEPWPVEFNDPVAWLVTAQALEKVESPRDMQGLEGDIIDAQASPTGSFVRDAQFWHKKFDTWLTAYQRTRYEQRPRREPYVL